MIYENLPCQKASHVCVLHISSDSSSDEIYIK